MLEDRPMSNEYRHIELMVGDVRRRRWTTERKLQIIEESYAPGETVSSAARRCAKSSLSLEMATKDQGSSTHVGINIRS